MKAFLFVIIFVAGCTVNLNLDHEYAVNSGDGDITETATAEEKSETTADVKMDSLP